MGSFGWEGGLSLALDAAERPVVSYFSFDGSTSTLHVLHCGDAFCAAGNTDAPFPGLTGGGSSIDVDSADNPVASFADAGGSGLHVVHCVNASCSFATNVLVDATASAGLDSSVEVDAADHPVVSYGVGGVGDLRLVHCATASCP